jgi:hypothetical protein
MAKPYLWLHSQHQHPRPSLYLAVCDFVNFCVTMKIVFADSGDEEEIQASSSSSSELNKVNTKYIAHNLPLGQRSQFTQNFLTKAHNLP